MDSAFQAMLDSDLDNVFFNSSEFAESHRIEGRDMPAIIDGDALEDLKARSQYADSIYNAELLFFVKKNDLGYRPAKGGLMDFDGEQYRVLEADLFADGMYQIILGDVV